MHDEGPRTNGALLVVLGRRGLVLRGQLLDGVLLGGIKRLTRRFESFQAGGVQSVVQRAVQRREHVRGVRAGGVEGVQDRQELSASACPPRSYCSPCSRLARRR